MSTNNHADFTKTTARLAILKAKAAYYCKIHPDVLVLFGHSEAEKRAYAIAQNTLSFNDKTFLLEKITQAVKNELEMACVTCRQCTEDLSESVKSEFYEI